MKTDNETLVKALRILVNDIQTDDGVANACIAEAALRIEELLVAKGNFMKGRVSLCRQILIMDELIDFKSVDMDVLHGLALLINEVQ